jgi:glycosyltransferase involved in cell wall biosynthesis
VKILLVLHQFFPQFTAGTEVLTLGVARELRERGHDIRIFSAHPSRDDMTEAQRFDRYTHEGFEVYRFHHAYVPMAGQISMIDVGSDNHLAAHFFSNVLAGFQPQRVHYFHLNRLGTGLIVEADKAGVRQSMTPTDFWARCPTAQLRYPDGKMCNGPSRNAGNCVKHFAQDPARPRGLRAMARLLPTRVADALVRSTLNARPPNVPAIADMWALGLRLEKTVARLNRLESIAAPNAFMRGKLVEHGVDQRLIHDISFGVHLAPPSSAAPVQETLQAGPLRLGFIGTLAPHKGALVLVQAFRQLEPGSASLCIY